MTTTSTQRGHHNTTDKPYSVTLWGSNPDETDNDDCWTGDEFLTLGEAVACYREILGGGAPWPSCRRGWEYIMIDGPDFHEVSPNPDRRTVLAHRREAARSDAEWRHEQAVQAGMAFGAEGYNDAMGW